MKYTLIAVSVLLLTGLSKAVVGHNGSGGDLSITGTGSSASASTAVSPNGTHYTAEVSMVNRTPQIGNETVSGVEFESGEKNSVSFEGRIRAPTPCHVIGHEVRERGENSYILNVETARESPENRFCTQQLVMVNYRAGFETGEPFQLVVEHSGEEVRTLEHPGFGNETDETQEEPGQERRGIIAGIRKWISSLF